MSESALDKKPEMGTAEGRQKTPHNFASAPEELAASGTADWLSMDPAQISVRPSFWGQADFVLALRRVRQFLSRL